MENRTIKYVWTLWLVGFVGVLSAQVHVDNEIILQGIIDTDKQVLGLPPSTFGADALSARTEQTNSHRYAVSVNNDWAYTVAGITTPVAGTQLILKVSALTSGNVAFTVNGNGPYALVYSPSVPVPGNSLTVNAMLSVVFNGTEFQLMNTPLIRRGTCPTGTVAVSESLCITQNEVGLQDQDFFTAIAACDSLGLRMCSWGEWYEACSKAVPIGLNNMLGNWEWTNDMVNEDGHSRWTGLWGCYSAGTGPVLNPVGVARCCYSR